MGCGAHRSQNLQLHPFLRSGGSSAKGIVCPTPSSQEYRSQALVYLTSGRRLRHRTQLAPCQLLPDMAADIKAPSATLYSCCETTYRYGNLNKSVRRQRCILAYYSRQKYLQTLHSSENGNLTDCNFSTSDTRLISFSVGFLFNSREYACFPIKQKTQPRDAKVYEA